ncbi:hypothetical protein PAAG_07819 [Paracoccidioides lutzii Pb01]|uniref:PH domain-containing protein n=1 Tax=Paracoccidioides lutzii (strain ATCC MYA-826 / Pb01) TaxID=502779 RepID=C1HA90_PARBA|nr:hypothetical protein PAAG_07819 [Paracoccidioides lutzii Pb01]EEH37263.1 hypothetical protein PAAG_07819 [Paracoccidioides lutzii Pb01]
MTQTQPQPKTALKFSRYRSVRNAAEANVIQHAAAQSFPDPSSPPPLSVNAQSSPPSSVPKTRSESIKRSMSRYRHAKPGATKAANSVPPPPPLPAEVTLPKGQHTQGAFLQDIHETRPNELTSKEDAGSTRHQHHSDTVHSSFSPYPQGPVQPPNQSIKNDSWSARSMDSGVENANSSTEYLPQERNSSVSSMEDSRPRPPHTSIDVQRSKVLATNKSHNTPTKPSRLRTVVEPRIQGDQDHVQRITSDELAANERAAAKHHCPKPKQQSGKGKTSGFLSRMMFLDPTSHSKLNNNSDNHNHNNNHRDKLKTLISSPRLIRPEEVKVTSGNDAPVSAVNAGERKVLVTCNDSSISLPVTPNTQIQDLLYSAANCLPENIEPQSCILLESFKQLGLERPLRKYEHARDVMNSWDTDSQNHLIVSRLPDRREREGLDVKSAPRKQPSESVFHFYHSQRPGKWYKRWVTLRADGQVVIAKKQGGESVNICHLSDFDIYSLSSRETAKRVKVPKKICFAIKSQQKLSVFLTTENFVHYFATDDEQAAIRWYQAVQQWRSWYLVNVMGEGDTKEKQALSPSTRSPQSGNIPNGSNNIRNSDSSIGTFQPLLDLDPPSCKYESSESDSVSKDSFTKAVSIAKCSSLRTRSRRPQLFSSSNKSTKEPISESDAEPFTSTGLLGKSYSQRKKALEDREKEAPPLPFTGHGLLGTLAAEPPNSPTSSRRSSRDYAAQSIPTSPNGSISASFNRSKFIKQKPKPLVDLTPTYQEPVHHARKGRGVATDPGQPLVEAATSPELLPGAIVIPSATTWRKPTASLTSSLSQSHSTSPDIPHLSSFSRSGGVGAGARSSTARSTSVRYRQRATSVNNHDSSFPPVPLLSETSPTQPNSQGQEPLFSPTGLLARSISTSHGHTPAVGHGVATGDRNNFSKPMLDISQDSQFVEGSLLREVEVGEVGKGVGGKLPIPVPVIDRG